MSTFRFKCQKALGSSVRSRNSGKNSLRMESQSTHGSSLRMYHSKCYYISHIFHFPVTCEKKMLKHVCENLDEKYVSFEVNSETSEISVKHFFMKSL
jgi:hypothetical protein